jgi:RsiW-degrading membrane proteinase PrsW (M82 family)
VTADRSGPIPDDALARALLIARLVIAFYLVELLLNLTRPHVLPNEPTLTVFQKFPGFSGSLARLFATPRAVFWTVLAGIVVGAALQAFVAFTRPEGRRAVVFTWATLVAMLGPFALFALVVFGSYPLATIACVPSSAFALWLLHHGQRFARLPLPVLLTAFGWGALIVFGVGRAYSNLAAGTMFGYLGKPTGTDLSKLTRNLNRMLDYGILHVSIVNVLVVAAGVVLLLMMFRHRITDAVTGLVLGAAVGVGYSLVESVLFIKLYGSLSSIVGATGGFEYWIRQSIGLLGGQVTFGAVLGAGFGIAAQAQRRQERRLLAGAALVAAIGGAVASETLSAWLSHLVSDHIDVGGAFDTLVLSPLFWLLPQVPFFVLALLLLRAGWRERAAAARAAVAAEAEAGTAITRTEVPFLVDPGLRIWALMSTWRQYGGATALALNRLQTAQLDLAGWRWQQADDPEEGERLRAKVMRLKTGTRPVATP